jgi:putative membrane protein
MPIGPWELAIIAFILSGPVLLGILFAIYMLTRRSSESQGADQNRSPLDILDERYARGEIDSAEYEERRRRITGQAEE